jgi:Protein of unknown function (DUF1579)
MKSLITSLTLLVAFSLSVGAFAQGPEASPEHAILKKDVGTWDATMKFWMGPDGKADPSAQPMESKGTENGRLVGEFWLINDFNGDFGGMPFEGHGTTGYNPQAKKFQGSWVDSMTPFAMHMEGTYDEKTKTMTSMGKGVGPDGKETKSKSTVVYDGDNKRTMTMYELKAGTENEWVRSMEIVYTRQAASASAGGKSAAPKK